ncbi:trans-aconitate 2-methyltransferase [Kaistia geumhonensis]|nr:trans-aconitate 2-methyltransferase [Kaistia geumhonensis]MCX5481370.1 trans-aconitate 2-methyltransferase [Kaistia geumhonensis]
MDWSAGQYLKFEDERTRPARNLLAEVPLAAPRLCVDLGCGPGNSTELIAARYPGARVVGVDTAPDMLRAARERLPGVEFVEADVAAWQPDEPADLLFANAVFQWVPDHLAVLERLMGALAPGGVLAVQMPDNLGEPSHLMMEETARSAAFAEAFAGRIIRRTPLPAPRSYVERLAPLSARVEVWHTIYQHRLADAAAIVEWVKGTGLRPYLDVLPPERRAVFVDAYTARIAEAYPTLAAGGVLLAFPRLFIVAVKASG